MDTLIRKIEEIAKIKGIKGTQLGQMLGLKKSPLTDWRNGHSKPTLEQIIKICDFFAITPNELLGIKNEHNYTLSEEEQQIIDYFRICSKKERNILLAICELKNDSDEKSSAQSTIKIS